MTIEVAGDPPEEAVRRVDKLAVPKFNRGAEVRAASYDEADDSVEVVFTTGAGVRRRDWSTGRYYVETLDVTPQAVKLERLNAGAPFLNAHLDYELSDIIGSVVPGTARVQGGKGLARVTLSKAPEHAGIVANIRAGVIKNISVGYFLRKVEKTENAGDRDDEWRVVEWEPYEISAVPVPADMGAQIRGHAELHDVELDVRSFRPLQDVEAARKAERNRITTITELADMAKEPEYGRRHIDAGTSLEMFREIMITRMAEKDMAYEINTHYPAETGLEHHQKRARAIESVILHRVDARNEMLPGASEFRGMSLLELARETLEANGVKTRGMSRQDIAGIALQHRSGGMNGTSDFPTILGNVIGRSLRSGYEAAGQTFRPFVRETTVPDFKEVTRAQLGEAPALEKVNEHGEYKRGTIGEGSEKYKIATYGKIIGITRQAIINDDMNAFGRIPASFGVQAAQLESDLVWWQILSNPTMGDNVALFHATHKNLQTAAALGITPLATMRTAMAKLTGVDAKTVLNIQPAYLLTPIALETAAEQLLKSVYYPQAATGVAPESMRKLSIISEPRIDNGIDNPSIGAAVAGSSTAYYLAASPGQIDTVELAYLEGNRGVYTETRQGFDVDGLEIKVRLDAGAKVIDWRSFQKNPGA